MTQEQSSIYDNYATEYATYVAEREKTGDPTDMLPIMLDLLGDVSGRMVLDAGCGDGYLTRILAARGAHMTGIDLSPRLIALAQAQGHAGQIAYRVGDLSAPLHEDMGSYDAVASFFVLNDVEDYRSFATTLASVLKPGGRLVLAFNSPYGAVIRNHVKDYFDSGAASPYLRLWEAGIKVYHYHRTLEEYLDSFFTNGLRLTKLVDVSTVTSIHGQDTILPEGYRFPRYMLLAFTKP